MDNEIVLIGCLEDKKMEILYENLLVINILN